MQRYSYGVFLNFPGIRSKVQLQVDEAVKKLEDRLVPKGPGVTRYLTLPKEGLTDEQAKEELKKYVLDVSLFSFHPCVAGIGLIGISGKA